MFPLLLVCLPVLSWSLIAKFPVQIRHTTDSPAQDLQFDILEGQSPVRAFRNFCHKHKLLRAACTQMIGEWIESLDKQRESEIEDNLCSYDDDIIVRASGCSDVPLVWGAVQLYINLSQLGIKEACGELLLPAYEPNVHDLVYDFCRGHSLSGLHCRELYYEVSNFLTSLYARPKGLTLKNMLTGTFFQEELDYMYLYVDLSQSLSSKRVYFTQYRSHFVESICTFCLTHKLNRETCTKFAEHVNTEMIRYYGQDSLELWCMLYVMRSINTIVANQPTKSLDHTDQHQVKKLSSNITSYNSTSELQSSSYVDADFIEIGTSNFNTITQLIDDADRLVGFAVEPSLHYLNSLPNKTGVTKANCAIVSAADAAQGVKTVDFYYIPEKIIVEKGLHSFLKGCNSVGAYHPFHVAFGLQQYVVIEKVTAYTLVDFLLLHHIRRIRLLKIDAEGYDVVIMEELYQYMVLKNDTTLYPERIVFESNVDSQKQLVEKIIHKFVKLGYVMRLIGSDTVLELPGLV